MFLMKTIGHGPKRYDPKDFKKILNKFDEGEKQTLKKRSKN